MFYGSFALPDSGSDSDSDSEYSHRDWDSSLDLCNVNIQYITIVAKGKILWIRVRVGIRVRQCKRDIIVANPETRYLGGNQQEIHVAASGGQPFIYIYFLKI